MTKAQEEFSRLAERVARERDRVAFEVLFDHFAPRLNGYLQRLGLTVAQAEELTQEVMIVLWHKAHLFDPAKSSLSTWLFRIARNRRIDAVRRDRSHLIDPLDPMFQPEETPSPDASLDEAVRGERIRDALASLPEEQMVLIRYAFFEGLSHTEIAERTSLPLGTVKSRIRLAFGRLRKMIEIDPRIDT